MTPKPNEDFFEVTGDAFISDIINEELFVAKAHISQIYASRFYSGSIDGLVRLGMNERSDIYGFSTRSCFAQGGEDFMIVSEIAYDYRDEYARFLVKRRNMSKELAMDSNWLGFSYEPGDRIGRLFFSNSKPLNKNELEDLIESGTFNFGEDGVDYMLHEEGSGDYKFVSIRIFLDNYMIMLDSNVSDDATYRKSRDDLVTVKKDPYFKNGSATILTTNNKIILNEGYCMVLDREIPDEPDLCHIESRFIGPDTSNSIIMELLYTGDDELYTPNNKLMVSGKIYKLTKDHEASDVPHYTEMNGDGYTNKIKN